MTDPSEPPNDAASRPEEQPEPRPLTIDDVPRLGSGGGIAVGCAVVVVVAIILFWMVRGWMMHAL